MFLVPETSFLLFAFLDQSPRKKFNPPGFTSLSIPTTASSHPPSSVPSPRDFTNDDDNHDNVFEFDSFLPLSTSYRSNNKADDSASIMPSADDEGIKGTGEYKVLMNQDEERKVNTSLGLNPEREMRTSYAASTGLVDFILHHPALPVMCYCAASILMTVVNKVS